MPSEFLVQIVSRLTGEVVRSWAPGLEVEKQFEDELVNRVVAKGVGLGRTSAHVAADVRAAIGDLLYDLKVQVPRP